MTDPGSAQPTLQFGDSLIGKRVGEYVIERELGSGGMGIVYGAVHPVIGKRVAIKVLRWEVSRDPQQTERIISEGRAVNAIGHPAVVDIFGQGQLEDGRHYLAMELLEGTSLEQHLFSRGRLSPAEALPILADIFDALAATHRAGVIHRDIKPSNVFLLAAPAGRRRTVKVLDFGLAKVAVVPFGATPQTHTNIIVGTPDYIAPEQAAGKAVGPATDLYATGVLAYQMLVGSLPFKGATPYDVVFKHLNEPPPAPSTKVPALPQALEALVLQLLEKAPERRPASAEVVCQHLRLIAAALPTTAAQPPGARRARRLLGAGAGVMTLGLGLAAWLTLAPSPAVSPPGPATAREPAPPQAPAPSAVPLPPTPAPPPPKVQAPARPAPRPASGTRARLERIKRSWAVARQHRPAADVRTFDAMLDSLARQSARPGDATVAEVTQGLDDFVKDALAGAEP